MKAKEFIRLFVPPICGVIKHKLCPPREPDRHPMPMRERKGDKMIVIGNGPSLNKTIEKYLDVLQNTECMMVNEACITPLFELLTPIAYLLVDPVYFKEEGTTDFSSIRDSVIEALVSKTKWPMMVIMPHQAKQSSFANRISKNPNIRVLHYEDTWRNQEEVSKFEAWDKNMVCPPSQTVLNTAIWLSIYWGYRVTYIVGADTSFIQDIYVGQKDNLLYTVDSHFYKNEDVYDSKEEPEQHGRPFNMDMEELLKAVHTMFADYKELRKYADWKGVKVYNASEYSMIDCFERKKLSE